MYYLSYDFSNFFVASAVLLQIIDTLLWLNKNGNDFILAALFYYITKCLPIPKSDEITSHSLAIGILSYPITSYHILSHPILYKEGK